MNELPLNLKIEIAKSRFHETLAQCIMEFGLPGFMLEGIIEELMLEVKDQTVKEMKRSYEDVINNLEHELNELKDNND